MGEQVILKCRCGYVSDALNIGMGFLGRAYEPGFCTQCHKIVSVLVAVLAPSASEQAENLDKCPHCGGHVNEVLRFWRPTGIAAWQRSDPQGREVTITCPRCSRPQMRMQTFGFWD